MVSCGAPLEGVEVAVVDPQSGQRVADGRIGEIWVAGPSIAAGYWNRPQDNFATFGARLADSTRPICAPATWDFCTTDRCWSPGVLKDVIIIRGRNLYPQDIEQTVATLTRRSTPALRLPWSRAPRTNWSCPPGRPRAPPRDLTPVLKAVRAAVVDEYELDPQAIVLLRPGGLPLTTSGKVQRNRCREMFEAGELPLLAEWRRPAAEDSAAGQAPGEVDLRPAFLDELDKLPREQLAAEVAQWILQWISVHLGEGAGELKPDATFPDWASTR